MKKKTLILITAVLLITSIIPYNSPMAQDAEKPVSKARPKVIRTTPYDEERYFDPEILYERFSLPNSEQYEEGYYIRATFENIGNTLQLKTTRPNGITVYIEGDKENKVDVTKELRTETNNQKQEFTIYIPLIEKLKDNQRYNVFIPEINYLEYSDADTGGNKAYSWSFNTNYLPKAEKLYEGSIPEGYDWNYPIVIDGSMFHINTTVRFRDMSGRAYYPYYVDVWGDNRLYIYLPRRSLPIGAYDIIIDNGRNYETEMLYGVLSVIKQGDYVPNEEYRTKDKTILGTVKESINKSEDTLNLNPSLTNRINLEIDLDELMGSETWVRNLEYPASWRDYLHRLVLKSKWTNISIENLRLDYNTDENHIKLRAGRVEPRLGDILENRLIGYNIKSDFIEVSGANFDFSSLLIEIPYLDSDGRRLKLLRYDEVTRVFEKISHTVDLIDGKLIGFTTKPGIFVIVEEGWQN